MTNFDKPPVEQPKEPTVEQPSQMNLLTNYDATIKALIEMEGEEWFALQEKEREGQRPDLDRSIQGALLIASKLHPEFSNGRAVLNGAGGTHRYYVKRNGEVEYSATHGPDDVRKAKKLGFVLNGPELLVGRFRLDYDDAELNKEE